MTIDNGLAGVLIDNVSVDVIFTDRLGVGVKATSDPNDLTAKFYIRPQTDRPVPASIPGGTSAKIAWLIIPATGTGGQNPQGELFYAGGARGEPGARVCAPAEY